MTVFITRPQTLAGATNFDGTAGQGLIDFLDLPLSGNNANIVPLITGISFDNDNAETVGIECFLKPAAEPLTTTIRKTIRRPADPISQFNLDGCKIPVPRQISGTNVFTPWQLILITTGKTAVASWIVSYTMGPVGGSINY